MLNIDPFDEPTVFSGSPSTGRDPKSECSAFLGLNSTSDTQQPNGAYTARWGDSELAAVSLRPVGGQQPVDSLRSVVFLCRAMMGSS